MLWWALEEIRLKRTGRSARYTELVLELAWNPGPGSDPSLAAELLAVGVPKASQLWAPIGSVVLVAPGADAHPGVQPALDTVREQWPGAEVRVVDETVAALVGAGQDPEPAACVVVHLDAVHSSVALVAGREVVASGLSTGGARGLADAVIGHVREEDGLDLGLEVAWSAVVHGGAFAPSPTVPGPLSVDGSPITDDSARPRQQVEVTLSPTGLRAVVAPAYQPVVDLVARVLRDAPPETARQATAGGLLLTGPHPPGAEDHLTERTGLSARRVAEPRIGFEHPQVLRDGVDRLLAENPPTPVIADERTDRFRRLIADWGRSPSDVDQDAYTPEELAWLELLRLLPRRPTPGDR
ncbi:rod shape-determining protein [Streptomyces sp. NPDC050549]|uniref:rod shape-determining protein n=1 Tax=Streptomyces sp. NPDC050549 TaxID=3155406 RepID=UPI00341DDD84